MINPFKETVDYSHNKMLSEHCKKYCDVKCPSGDKGSHGWHGKEGMCWDCEFNPYNMYPELRENK